MFLGFRLGFIHPDMGKFRVGEEAIGNKSAKGRAVAAVEITEHDAKIVVAGVRELRAAGTVAHGPNIGRGGLKSFVDVNITSGVEFNCLPWRRRADRYWVSARRRPEYRTPPMVFSVAADANLELHAVARTAYNREQFRLQQDLNAFVADQQFDGCAMSASSCSRSCLPRCTIVTRLPKRRMAWANSSPT